MDKEVPMIMYHLWVGPPDGESRSISAIIPEFTSPIQFAQKYFHPKPLYLPFDECHKHLLNQFAGAKIPGWKTNVRVSEEENFNYYQTDLVPDAWFLSPLFGNQSELDVLTMQDLEKNEGIVLAEQCKDPVARYCGLP